MNWIRENEPPSTDAVDLIASVFARPGHALDQQVPAGEQADEQPLEHLLLAGDHAPDLEERLLELRQVLLSSAVRRVSHQPYVSLPARVTWISRHKSTGSCERRMNFRAAARCHLKR